MELPQSIHATWTPRVPGLPRIVTGFLFLQRGSATRSGVAGVLELFGRSDLSCDASHRKHGVRG